MDPVGPIESGADKFLRFEQLKKRKRRKTIINYRHSRLYISANERPTMPSGLATISMALLSAFICIANAQAPTNDHTLINRYSSQPHPDFYPHPVNCRDPNHRHLEQHRELHRMLQTEYPNHRLQFFHLQSPNSETIIRHENLNDKQFNFRQQNKQIFFDQNRPANNNNNRHQQLPHRNTFNVFDNEQFVIHPAPPPTPLFVTNKRRQQTILVKQQTETNQLKQTATAQKRQKIVNTNKKLTIVTDIDECLDERACGRGAHCENLPGSFRCSCPAGFTGNPQLECIGKYLSIPCFALSFALSLRVKWYQIRLTELD